MNLDDDPTPDQLAALLAVCDDEAAHHVLWVDRSGRAHVSPLPDELTPIGFEATTPNMAMRYETFSQGCGYVGPEAANDTKFVADLLRTLTTEWQQAGDSVEVIYID